MRKAQVEIPWGRTHHRTNTAARGARQDRRVGWRTRRGLLGSALVWALLITGAPAAAALPAERPDATWMTNGPVRAIARMGETIYIGGQFTRLCEVPAGAGACGRGPTVSVSNLAAINAATGEALGYDPATNTTIFAPTVTGGTSPIVYDLEVSPSSNRLFVGGKFARVNGFERKNVAAFYIDPRTGEGTLDPDFNPMFPSRVFGLAASPTRVYVGGTFASVVVGGVTHIRHGLAAFDYDGAIDLEWTPSAGGGVRDGGVRELKLAKDDGGASIFVTGDFDTIDGLPRKTLAKLDAGGSGAPRHWSPGDTAPAMAFGEDLVATRTALLVAEGGSDFAAGLDAVTGEQLWRTDTNGAVQAIALMGSQPIIGGHFRYVADDVGENCPLEGGTCARRARLAALDPQNGYVVDLSWTPTIAGDFNGVWSLLRDGPQLYLGGEFLKVSGVEQQYFARLSDPQ